MKTTITNVYVHKYVLMGEQRRILVVEGEISKDFFPFWVMLHIVDPAGYYQSSMHLTAPISGRWKGQADIFQDGIHTITAQCNLMPFIRVPVGEPTATEFDTTGK